MAYRLSDAIFQAQVLYDFAAQADGELQLMANEILTIVSEVIHCAMMSNEPVATAISLCITESRFLEMLMRDRCFTERIDYIIYFIH